MTQKNCFNNIKPDELQVLFQEIKSKSESTNEEIDLATEQSNLLIFPKKFLYDPRETDLTKMQHILRRKHRSLIKRTVGSQSEQANQ